MKKNQEMKVGIMVVGNMVQEEDMVEGGDVGHMEVVGGDMVQMEVVGKQLEDDGVVVGGDIVEVGEDEVEIYMVGTLIIIIINY